MRPGLRGQKLHCRIIQKKWRSLAFWAVQDLLPSIDEKMPSFKEKDPKRWRFTSRNAQWLAECHCQWISLGPAAEAACMTMRYVDAVQKVLGSVPTQHVAF